MNYLDAVRVLLLSFIDSFYSSSLFPTSLPPIVVPPLWRSVQNRIPAPIYALGWYITDKRLCTRFQDDEAQFIELYIVTPDWHRKYNERFGNCVHNSALTA